MANFSLKALTLSVLLSSCQLSNAASLALGDKIASAWNATVGKISNTAIKPKPTNFPEAMPKFIAAVTAIGILKYGKTGIKKYGEYFNLGANFQENQSENELARKAQNLHNAIYNAVEKTANNKIFEEFYKSVIFPVYIF